MDWLTATEALTLLGTQPQTLYANVSRGRIKARRDPGDVRRSLYNGEDVRRLAARGAGRRTLETVAAETIHFGDPVLRSSISTIVNGRLLYRGRDAVEQSQSRTLEQIAGLLWESDGVRIEGEAGLTDGPPLRRAFVALAGRAATDPPSLGRTQPVLRIEAAAVLSELVVALVGKARRDVPIHELVAARWGRPEAAEPIRRALVLLADHELNASTFAARVTVSTGASLAAAALSGLAALSGPLHGGASAALGGLVARADEIGAEQAVLACLAEGRPVPSFGHPLYRDGDIRAMALLDGLKLTSSYQGVLDVGVRIGGEQPNVDFALAALAARYDLPGNAPFLLFAMARCVGWLAHALEQVATGHLIRPRAHYIGRQAS